MSELFQKVKELISIERGGLNPDKILVSEQPPQTVKVYSQANRLKDECLAEFIWNVDKDTLIRVRYKVVVNYTKTVLSVCDSYESAINSLRLVTRSDDYVIEKVFSTCSVK